MKLLLIGKNTSCDLEEDALTLLLKSQVPSLHLQPWTLSLTWTSEPRGRGCLFTFRLLLLLGRCPAGLAAAPASLSQESLGPVNQLVSLIHKHVHIVHKEWGQVLVRLDLVYLKVTSI